MRGSVLLALLGLAAVGPLFAASPDAHAVIERCAREADPSARGIDALRRSCPQLETAVHELGLDPFLPAGWQKSTSARALADLVALADRYAAPAPTLRLDPARLQSIARALEPPPAPPSFWARVEAWIGSWLAPKTGSTSSWLRFLPRWALSPRNARLIFGALAAAIVIGVAALVVGEFKASGLIGARNRRLPRRGAVEPLASGAASLDLEALDSAIPRDRPALLLRLLVRALTRSQRLEHDRNLTCRELIATARFDNLQQREQFEQVALLAERALYGDATLAPSGIPEEMLTRARALHAALLAAPRLEPAGS